MNRKPMMPQTLRLALSDAMSYDPNSKIGGAKNNFNFSKFKKLKSNHGLNVILLL
jgi:hypothetical protein